ncbi:Sugar phosphatase YfbT [Stieleria maiorica]|uniref:Sugar phosphatase YfbT n=1 Tax=Stieleria maiorica TaxID=2795974 RepID=A0A5B9MKL3_9BACT|nr:Sugar phosphatase YfbT [Stieleria maiorica]
MSPEQFSALIKQASLLLFDLDGTLVDSSRSVRRAWRDFAARHQVAESAIFAISEGRQGHAVVSELRPDLDAQAEDRRLVEHQIADTADVVEIAGAARLLHQLEPTRWAIVTSCTERLATARLDAAGLPRPRLLITADDTMRSKPDPEGLQLAMKRCGVQPSECVAFEDSQAGIVAAVRAGTRVIQIGPRSHSSNGDTVASIRDWNLFVDC